MSVEVLEAALRCVVGGTFAQNWIELLWHAGEPLAAGIAFYRSAQELIGRYRRPDLRIVQTVQTNGTLIDDAWCRLFREHNFRVGVSIDGPSDLHDRARTTWSGRPTHTAAMRGVARLRSYGFAPAALCVITRETMQRPDDIFDFFTEAGFTAIAFNVEEIENEHRTSSIGTRASNLSAATVELYQHFMSRIFDRWWPIRDRLRIREFDDALEFVVRRRADPLFVRDTDESKAFGILTVQKNGDVTPYSPEFAGTRDQRFSNFVIGNVLHDDAETLYRSLAFAKIRGAVEQRKRLCAMTCGYFATCGGAYISNRYFETGDLTGTATISCVLQRQAITLLVLDKMRQLAAAAHHQAPPPLRHLSPPSADVPADAALSDLSLSPG